MCRPKVRVELVRSGNPQAVFIEGPGMIGAPHKRPHFCHAREMRGIQASDGTASNDADSFHLIFPDIAAAR